MAAACGGDHPPEQTEVAGIPVLEDSTSGPGTELGAGFTVAEGSVLLGTVFPARTSYLDDGGFRALLLVTGPFREVFGAYQRQAAHIGLPLAPDFGRSYCSPDRVYLCSGRSDPGLRGRAAWVRAWRRPGGPDRPPVSHLYLQYRDVPEEGQPSGSVERPAPRADVGEPSETGPWPRLPEVGEPVEPRVDGQEPLVLVEEAQLVAHRGLGTCSPSTGSTLVLRTEDPEEVIERIAEQYQDEDGVHQEARTEDGAEIVHRMWHSGGGGYALWAVTRPDEPTYLLIDRCPVD